MRAAKQRGWKPKAAIAFRQGPVPARPIAVAVAEAQQILAAAAATAAAAAAVAAPAAVVAAPTPKPKVPVWKCKHCSAMFLTKPKFRHHHESLCRRIGTAAACFDAIGMDCDKCVVRVVECDDATLLVQGDTTGRVVSTYIRSA